MKGKIQLGIYQHYKGKKYLVIGLARHSETLEKLVVYIPLYESDQNTFWVRPVKMFLEEVEFGGKKVKRFEYLGSN